MLAIFEITGIVDRAGAVHLGFIGLVCFRIILLHLGSLYEKIGIVG